MAFKINGEYKGQFRDYAQKVDQAGRKFGEWRDTFRDKDPDESEAQEMERDYRDLEQQVKKLKEYFGKYTGIQISS